MTTANTGGTARATRRRTPVQMAALAVGAVFLLVGIAGFIPGVTTNYDQLMGAGHHSGAMLLGIFNVSILHNVVHLLFGVAGVLMARTAPQARNYLIGGGIIYAVLFVYGLVIDHESAANFVPLNQADNWLHLILSIGMIALGVLLGKRSLTATSSPNALAPQPSGGAGGGLGPPPPPTSVFLDFCRRVIESGPTGAQPTRRQPIRITCGGIST
jgi:hypothetical protein